MLYLQYITAKTLSIMAHPNAILIEEFINKRKEMFNLVSKGNVEVTFLDKVAIWITNHVGSMWFFLIIFVWTVLWWGEVYSP